MTLGVPIWVCYTLDCTIVLILIPRKIEGDPSISPGSRLGNGLHHTNLRCFSTNETFFFMFYSTEM
jgi:hypothetical protein